MIAYQIKVTIRNTHPPIWRRLIVPEGYSFAQLSVIINEAFGWCGYHLYEFRVPSLNMRIDEEDMEDDFGSWRDEEQYDATVFSVQDVFEEANRLVYTYDFGDDWQHDILVEKTLDPAPYPYPQVIKYKGNCPPEDCGGVWGYYDLLEILGDENHPEHEDMKTWVEETSPEYFRDYDVDYVNRALQSLQLKGKTKKPLGREELYQNMWDNKAWKKVVFELFEEDALLYDPEEAQEREIERFAQMIGFDLENDELIDAINREDTDYLMEYMRDHFPIEKFVPDYVADLILNKNPEEETIPISEMELGKNYVPPTREQWKDLFEIGFSLVKMKPWQYIANDNIIILSDKSSDEEVYVGVLGNGGMDFGFNFLEDLDALIRYVRLFDHEIGEDPYPGAMLEQKVLAVWAGEKANVPPEQEKLIREFGLTPRGRAKWVSFMRMAPSYFPWTINREEAGRLQSYLGILNEGLKLFEKEKDHDSLEFCDGIRIVQDEMHGVQVEMIPALEMRDLFQKAGQLQEKQYSNISEIERKKLQKVLPKSKQNMNGQEIDIDIRSLGMPVAPGSGDPDGRPLSPRLLVLLDGEEGTPVSYELFHGEDDAVSIREYVVNWMKESGVPMLFTTPNRDLCSILKPIEELVGTGVYFDSDMPWMNDFYEMMMNAY